MSVPFLSPPSNEAPKDVLRRVLKQGPVPDGFDTAEAWLRAWFDPLEFSLKDEEIYVRFPHVLFASWFEQHGRGALEKAAHQIWGTDARLRYEHSPAFRRGTIFLRSQPGGKVKPRHARKHFPLPVPQPLKAFSAAAKISSL